MCGVTNSNGPIMHILTIFYPFDNNSTLSKHLQNTLCDNILLLSDKTFLSRAEKIRAGTYCRSQPFLVTFAFTTNHNNHGQKTNHFCRQSVFYTEFTALFAAKAVKRLIITSPRLCAWLSVTR